MAKIERCGKSINCVTNYPFLLLNWKERINMAALWGAQIRCFFCINIDRTNRWGLQRNYIHTHARTHAHSYIFRPTCVFSSLSIWDWLNAKTSQIECAVHPLSNISADKNTSLPRPFIGPACGLAAGLHRVSAWLSHHKKPLGTPAIRRRERSRTKHQRRPLWSCWDQRLAINSPSTKRHWHGFPLTSSSGSTRLTEFRLVEFRLVESLFVELQLVESLFIQFRLVEFWFV